MLRPYLTIGFFTRAFVLSQDSHCSFYFVLFSIVMKNAPVSVDVGAFFYFAAVLLITQVKIFSTPAWLRENSVLCFCPNQNTLFQNHAAIILNRDVI
jgi:hypothetical protein